LAAAPPNTTYALTVGGTWKANGSLIRRNPAAMARARADFKSWCSDRPGAVLRRQQILAKRSAEDSTWRDSLGVSSSADHVFPVFLEEPTLLNQSRFQTPCRGVAA